MFILRLAYICALLASAHGHPGSQRSDNLKNGTSTVNSTLGLQKRYSNVRFTYYDVGPNACGSTDQNSDFVAALDSDLWGDGSHCYAKITVQYQGKAAAATITDECTGCGFEGLNLSPGLFTFLAGSTDPGAIYGSWFYD